MLSSLKRFVGRLILPDLTALHWRCYRRALQAKGLRGSLLRARVRRLQRKQCADIPIKQDITPFTTPHGLSGIFISVSYTHLQDGRQGGAPAKERDA